MSAEATKREAWAETVQALARERDLRYDPSAASTRWARPSALCPGGTNRLTGELADDFWGASCDADEHEEGGLFSQGGAARGGARQGARARPGQGDAAVQRRVDRAAPEELVMQSASRRKVEFECIEFNKRFLATVPSEYDPVALRELFSPGFLDWVTTIDNEVDFGISEQQLWFLWRLQRPHPRAARGGARQRRRAVQADPQRGRGVGRPHLPAGPWHAGLEPFPDS